MPMRACARLSTIGPMRCFHLLAAESLKISESPDSPSIQLVTICQFLFGADSALVKQVALGTT